MDAFKATPEVLVYNAGGTRRTWPPPGLLDIQPGEFEAAWAGGVNGAFYWLQQVKSPFTPSVTSMTIPLALLLI